MNIDMEMVYKKKELIILIIIIIVIVLGVMWFFTRETFDDRLRNYLLDNDFVLEDDLYTKQISDINLDEYYEQIDYGNDATYEVLYFDIYNYQLLETDMDYYDGVSMILSSIYDFKDNSLIYTSEVSLDGVTVIFDGSYDGDKKKLVCDVSSSDVNLSSDDKNTICDGINTNVEDFYKGATNLIDDDELVKGMKEK